MKKENSFFKIIKKILTVLVGVSICYSAVALQIKVGMGCGAVDAAINTMANLLGITVGTFSMIFHGSFLLGQILFERKNFKPIQLFQIMNIVCGGSLLDFVLYILLKNVVINSIVLRFIVCLLSFPLSALGCDLILESHFIRTPLEGFTELVGVKINQKPGKLRMYFDIFLVILVTALTLIFKLEWTIGVGTIIAAVIFGPAMDLFRKPVQEILRKLKVVSEEEQLQHI